MVNMGLIQYASRNIGKELQLVNKNMTWKNVFKLASTGDNIYILMLLT